MAKKSLYYTYSYSGYRQGVKVQGFQKASSMEELGLRLEKKQIKLLKATQLLPAKGGVANKEVIRFANQMHSMIKNGISSTEAIQMYAEYADEDFQFILSGVLNSLNQGISLSEAFRKTGFFSNLFSETIAMGEASATLISLLKI